MLKQRVLTAIALVLLVFGAIFNLSALLFEAFLAFVVVLAAWEWSAFVGLKKALFRFFYAVLVLLGLCLGRNLSIETLKLVLFANVFWWVLSFIFISIYPKFSQVWQSKIFVGLIGFWVLYPCWLALVHLRLQSGYIFHILLLLGLVAAADIGAYFSGRALGKHKLAPQVSPGKTWEGVWGGMLACCLLMLGVSQFESISASMIGLPWFGLLACAVLIAAYSVVGDLSESLLKRVKGLKDSGSILPGHGGVMDRIDGLVAVAPLYTLLVISFGEAL